MDPEAVLEIIQSQTTRTDTAPIRYMKLRDECVVFYTEDYTITPHSLEQIAALMTVAGQETQAIYCEKYASAYSVFEVHGPGEFSEGCVVIGCHLSSCGSLKDVENNREQYIFMGALARELSRRYLDYGRLQCCSVRRNEVQTQGRYEGRVASPI